jgi:nicotinamide-nucleotide amidase
VESALLLVGDELLCGRTRDSNLQRLADILGGIGLPVAEASVVGDSRERIAEALRRLAIPGRMVIVTGGLGPTDDDLTTEAVASAFGLCVERSSEAESMLLRRQAISGTRLSDSSWKQANIPSGAVPVFNPVGIAPGYVLRHEELVLICLPGVPAEASALLPGCLEAAGVEAVESLPVSFIRTWGLRENGLFDILREASAQCGVVPAYLPSPGRVDIKVSGDGAEVFSGRVLKMLGRNVYSRSRDETLEMVLGDRLLSAGLTLSTAESCTGGGIGAGLTAVAGSSLWYAGGVISYSNRMKIELLGVSEKTLEKHGAVSSHVVREMAEGVARLSGTQCSVAVTGIAGPSGGVQGKPVGTVWTAAMCSGRMRAFRWRLSGGREAVREGAGARALGVLLEMLS